MTTGRSRRATYYPAVPAETFIVPLLAEHITRFIDGLDPGDSNPATVLDVGCGEQPFRGALESKGYTYWSMDVVQNHNGSVHFICGIDAELPVAVTAPGPYDVVLCTEVLEHVADWGGAFKNLADLLRPGGQLLVTCPHFYPLHEEPEDYWRPTSYALEHFAKKNGMSVVSACRAGGSLDVLGTLLGNMYFKSNDRGMTSAAVLFSCKALRKSFFWLLQKRFVQNRISATGYYLSNVYVFSR